MENDPNYAKRKRRNAKRWLNVNKDKSAEYHRKYHQKIRMECLVAYGGKEPCCKCCGERFQDFLTLDHIEGNGHQHRMSIKKTIYAWLRERNFPPGFQVLCLNCNAALFRLKCTVSQLRRMLRSANRLDYLLV